MACCWRRSQHRPHPGEGIVAEYIRVRVESDGARVPDVDGTSCSVIPHQLQSRPRTSLKENVVLSVSSDSSCAALLQTEKPCFAERRGTLIQRHILCLSSRSYASGNGMAGAGGWLGKGRQAGRRRRAGEGRQRIVCIPKVQTKSSHWLAPSELNLSLISTTISHALLSVSGSAGLHLSRTVDMFTSASLASARAYTFLTSPASPTQASRPKSTWTVASPRPGRRSSGWGCLPAALQVPPGLRRRHASQRDRLSSKASLSTRHRGAPGPLSSESKECLSLGSAPDRHQYPRHHSSYLLDTRRRRPNACQERSMLTPHRLSHFLS